MKKKVILTWLILLISGITLAHSDFRKGFLITLQNDTLQGDVEFKARHENSTKINFKDDRGITTYDADQIRGYGFHRGSFFTSEVVKGYFIEVLTDGVMSLYRVGSDFYVWKAGYEPNKLNPDIRRNEHGVRTEHNPGWKGVLSYWVSDCEKSSDLISGLRYNEQSLLKFVRIYNQCVNEEFTDYRRDNRSFRLQPGISAGFYNSNLIARKLATGAEFLYLADQYKSSDPAIGIIGLFSFPSFSHKIYLQTEIIYSSIEFSDLLIFEKYRRTEFNNTYIQLKTLSTPFSLKYRVAGNKLPFFMHLGLNINHNIHSKTLYTKEELWDESRLETTITEALHINKTEIGYIAGISVQRSLGFMDAGLNFSYQSNMVNNSRALATYLNKFGVSLILLWP